MRTDLSLFDLADFEQCRSALAAWHEGHDQADAERFACAFSAHCEVRLRRVLGWGEHFARYGSDAMQSILKLFLTEPRLAGARTVGYWNSAIANELIDTIDETNGARARRVLKGRGRAGRRFDYVGVDAQAFAAADGPSAATPEASVQAAQTLRAVKGALKTLPALRRWAFVARQAEPLYLVSRREITLQAKRLKVSREALVALLKAHDPKSDEARLRLTYLESAWRGQKAKHVASLQRAVNRATADLQALLPHLAIAGEGPMTKRKKKTVDAP